MDVLQLIDSDRQRSARLARALTQDGWQVRVSINTLAGLSSIENDAPDVILVHAEAEGLTAVELAEAVQGRPELQAIQVVLYPAQALAADDVAFFDLRIGSENPEQVAALLGGPRSAVAPAMSTPPSRNLELIRVIESVSQGALTGRLTISLRETTATHALLFDRGKIVHAANGNQSGIKALRCLILACKRGEGSWFQFDRIPVPRTADGQPRMALLSLEEICALGESVDLHETVRVPAL